MTITPAPPYLFLTFFPHEAKWLIYVKPMETIQRYKKEKTLLK